MGQQVEFVTAGWLSIGNNDQAFNRFSTACCAVNPQTSEGGIEHYPVAGNIFHHVPARS